MERPAKEPSPSDPVPKKPENQQRKVLAPQIVGLDDLFGQASSGSTSKAEFPLGSTMVISGPPGAGKTTFALSFVRSMLRDQSEEEESRLDAKHLVYYISTEVNRERLERMFSERGWLASEDRLFKPEKQTAGLHVINPPIEIERPVKTSEELVNYIIRQISKQTAPEKGQKAFIIIDSVTALFKDCGSPGEGRRQAHELLHRLRQQFPYRKVAEEDPLGMILLLSEHGIAGREDPGMETYIADFVIKLDVMQMPLGVRLRTLEIIKSQGKNIMLGSHTWVILTNKTLDSVIRGKSLKDKINNNNDLIEGKDSKNILWGTILICARPYFNLRGAQTKKASKFKSNEILENSGVRGLDQMLRFDPDYWFQPSHSTKSSDYPSIRPGSVTMIVGEAGTGKSSICTHILNENHMENRKCLMIGFESDGSQSAQLPNQNLETIFRARSALHFNLLLKEIRSWLEEYPSESKRVVIDGISNLAASHSPQEFSQMLDALIALFKQHPHSDEAKPATLFVTYETVQNDRFFDSEAFRMPADNIIALSHKEILDNRRTAVAVIKSCHDDYDTLVRELVLKHDGPSETMIKSGFDAYTGLLSGNIKSAHVVLQLFHENKREKLFNQGITRHLRSLLPYTFSLRDFSRYGIAATLEGKETHIRVPAGDVHIESMDEWWIAHKTAQLAETISNSDKKTDKEAEILKFKKEHHFVSLKGFVSTTIESEIKPGDFWCFEYEKVVPNLPENCGSTETGPFALPLYIDFGMLCVHSSVSDKLKGFGSPPPWVRWKGTDNLPWSNPDPDNAKDAYVEALNEFMIPWCQPDGPDFFEPPSQDQIPGEEMKTLVDKIKFYKDTSPALKYGFAWDSRVPETAASMLYEFAWAFNGSHDLFDPEKKDQNKRSIQRAFAFIGYLVHQGLAPDCPSLTDCAEAAFSRQYYSTFTDINERLMRNGGAKCSLSALGLMPPGPENWPSVTNDQERVTANGLEPKEDDKSARDERLKIRNSRYKSIQEGSPGLEGTHFGSPNQTDIAELNRWKIFRERLEECGSWDEVIKGIPNSGTKNGSKPCRTGHGCCGAWMLGVKGPTASPGIAQVVLEEVSSLEFSKIRARMGAGLPARQDFYRIYGDKPVTGMNHLSWNELLMFAGSRANRRERMYQPWMDPNRIHQIIFRWSNSIMLLAKSLADKSLSSVKAQLIHNSTIAVDELFTEAFKSPQS